MAEIETAVHPSTSRRSLAWLLLIAAACLLPFIGKPFHIDDPLFLRTAAQVQHHPFNFYGFTMNWLGTPLPMVKNVDNPPLTSYYIAVAAAIAGWSEPALHAAFLLPALAVVWGVFVLARRFSRHPFLATLATILTPVFLISGTTLMCDVMLLAFWVWAVAAFEEGLARDSLKWFLTAGLLAGLAILTKFTGLALVPLLGFYGFARRRRFGRWLAALVIPIIFAAGYEWLTRRMYGKGMLFAAGVFASEDRSGAQGGLVEKTLIGLGFLGGCFLPALFYLPFIRSRRLVPVLLGLLVPCLLFLFWQPHLKPLLVQDGHFNSGMFLEMACFIAGGILVLLLAAADFRQHRDSESLLLVLWVLGLVVFTVVLNWTINGRSLLPAVPAVGILLARRFDLRSSKLPPLHGAWPFCPILLAAGLSLFVACADARLAATNRLAAKELCAKYGTPKNTVWFEGHWGFQYYMEKFGAKPIDLDHPAKASGDILIVPCNSSNLYEPPMDLVRLIATASYLPDAWCATMNNLSGAGFYASIHGPLPFVIGPIKPDRFYVFEYK